MAHRRGLALICSVAVSVGVLRGQAPLPAPLAVVPALDLYERGSYPQFFEAIGRDGAIDSDLYKTFEKEADRWIGAAPLASRERRTLVAASVALEVAHLLRYQPADRAARYLVWASLLMRRHPAPVPSGTERLWYLASIAGMEELDEPWVLTVGRESGSSVLDPIRRELSRGGQLAIASARFPDEPRFLLARVAALEAQVPLPFLFAPSYLEFAQLHAKDRVSDEPQSTDERLARGRRAQAIRVLIAREQLPEVTQAYEALRDRPDLQAETELHVGCLQSAAMQWTSALDHLRRVPTLTTENYLRYLSQYFIGRTLHNMGDRDGATSAFEQATRIVPKARSAATLLAAELLLSDRAVDRDRAYPLLRDAYSDLAPDDPWRLYPRGDARLWPTYMAQLRQALK